MSEVFTKEEWVEISPGATLEESRVEGEYTRKEIRKVPNDETLTEAFEEGVLGENFPLPPTDPIRNGQTSRRNSKCPCGSGRKYKVCCLVK